VKEKEMYQSLVRPINLLIVLILLQMACGLQPVSTPQSQIDISTNTPAIATPTARPTHTPTIVVPTPTLHFEIPATVSGKGILIGDIQWNSLPAVKSQVKVCSDFDTFRGCKGLEYSALTDEKGYFLIENVVPGDYTLLANLFGTSWYLYALEKVRVRADQTQFVDTFHLYKLDLLPIAPLNNKNIDVTQGNPTLEWQAYPDAAYYEITVNTFFKNDAIKQKVETNQFVLSDEIHLINCAYSWSISAYNQDGHQISQFKDKMQFNIINAGISCEIANPSPTDKAKLPQGNAQLSWDAHPLADYYIVYVVTEDDSFSIIMNKGGTKIEGSTTFDISDMPTGAYVWSVDAFDASNTQVATSGLLYFSIIAP